MGDTHGDDIYHFSGQVDLKFGSLETFPGSDSDSDESVGEASESGTESSSSSSKQPSSKRRKRSELSVESHQESCKVTPDLKDNPPGNASEKVGLGLDDDLISPPPSLIPRSHDRLNKRLKARSKISSFEKNLRALTNSFSDANSSLISLSGDEVDDIVKVKLRCHGIIEKWDMITGEPFLNCIKKIAQKEGVTPDCISLFVKDTKIQPTDCVSSLGVTVADIIECIIIEKEDSMNFAVGDSNAISVKIQMAGNKGKSSYNISRHCPLRVVLTQFCTDKNMDIKKIRVWFDGDAVSLESSPSELGMEDEDILDVATALR